MYVVHMYNRYTSGLYLRRATGTCTYVCSVQLYLLHEYIRMYICMLVGVHPPG